MNKEDGLLPFEPTHPGIIIKDEIDARAPLTISDLANRINVPIPYLEEIIKGERDITNDVASTLEKIWGIPANYWMKLQNQYDKDKERIAEKEDKNTVVGFSSGKNLTTASGCVPLGVKSKECSTCKHWDILERDYRGEPSVRDLGIGKCTIVKMYWDMTKWTKKGKRKYTKEGKKLKAFVQDGSDFMADLLTKPTFYCNQYENKPK